MQLNVLVTNHGKHSDAKLAIACAMEIIQIGVTASGQDALDGRKLENDIIGVLEGSFAKLAAFEHDSIDESGTEHLSSEFSAHPEIFDAAVKDITAKIVASPLSGWFISTDPTTGRTTSQVQGNIAKAVEKWLCAGHHMHRDWFARHGKVGHGTELTDHEDHDADCEHVKNWIARNS